MSQDLILYANCFVPFEEGYPATKAYYERLLARASFARVLEEAKPFLQYFPFKENLNPRFF